MKKDNMVCGFFFLLFILSSCGEYERLEIDKQAKRSADSLFRAHRDSLVAYFDNQCVQNHDSLYQLYFDSLRTLEAEKIKRLLEK